MRKYIPEQVELLDEVNAANARRYIGKANICTTRKWQPTGQGWIISAGNQNFYAENEDGLNIEQHEGARVEFSIDEAVDLTTGYYKAYDVEVI